MENVVAPIPGKILSVKVKVGEDLKAGDLVYILEAMKMENEIFCDEGGKVTQINVNEGDSVTVGDLVVVLE